VPAAISNASSETSKEGMISSSVFKIISNMALILSSPLRTKQRRGGVCVPLVCGKPPSGGRTGGGPIRHKRLEVATLKIVTPAILDFVTSQHNNQK
jgi:hypothetical protein